MARQELGPAALRVAQAVAGAWPGGDVVVGCSGGADSLALALAATWAARRTGEGVQVVVVDHGLQPESGAVAAEVIALLDARGVLARVARVEVDPAHHGGIEAAARDARLAALSAPGLPVLLGHTLDDQAETVLLGLLRGSGTRSLAGMAPVRGAIHRPLLGLRRADTEAACRDWGVEPWRDPMNDDPRFARVRARRLLPLLAGELGRDVAPALARTAALARADAELLDELAGSHAVGSDLVVEDLEALPEALRHRVIRLWLARHAPTSTMSHVLEVGRLVDDWKGQGPISVPGGAVRRAAGTLRFG